ncbi:hypothetical protein [Flavobacterium sp. NRK1]|uniref:hypothetical protein n=1 Tax=Flavobacterium sp. NRK1 TaxID=2954929 RepID=UPI0020920EB4|nr:hypothetical protein [Flavobacterium sp. NRK1]MCO6149063.1 hypothetical protein [Flavobacterium sp. NRK1]
MAKKQTTPKDVSAKLVAVTALCSLSGKYKLPYDKGQVLEIEEKQALELISNGDAVAAGQFGKAEEKNNKAAVLAGLILKAGGFGIEVPADATAEQVQGLIDESHANALAELNKLRGLTVVTNDQEKEAAAQAGKKQESENTADKGAAGAEKS